MAKKKKKAKPPVRYRRGVPNGFVRQQVNLSNAEIKTGALLEFSYGKRQKPGQIGGWKNDPRPTLLIFHDDGNNYIEGVNTNYLSDYYLKKLNIILGRFPGIDGDDLYNIVKTTSPFTIKKGYRKYIRSSVRNEYLYVEELLGDIEDEIKD